MAVGFLQAISKQLKFLVKLALITGLPAALPTLPLELTVLYNSLLFVLGTSDRVIEGEAEGIRQGLLRGKENNLCALVMSRNWPEEGEL